MTGTRFADATAVTPRGDGAYDVDLLPQYAIRGTKPNGGYLLATIGRAAVDAVRSAGAAHEHVIAAGAQYAASPDNGPAMVTTEVLRIGRTASQVRARLTQGDGAGVEARFIVGSLAAGRAPFWGGLPPVDLPPIEECVASPMGADDRDTRVWFDPATAITMTADGPRAGGAGELRAWFTLDGPDPIPTAMLLYVADCLPPATFSVVASGWVPTLDLSLYVRAIPSPGPLRLRFRVHMIQDGLADETLEAWDSEWPPRVAGLAAGCGSPPRGLTRSTPQSWCGGILAHEAIDRLADQVGMPGVTGVLLVHVDHDAPEARDHPPVVLDDAELVEPRTLVEHRLHRCRVIVRRPRSTKPATRREIDRRRYATPSRGR